MKGKKLCPFLGSGKTKIVVMSNSLVKIKSVLNLGHKKDSTNSLSHLFRSKKSVDSPNKEFCENRPKKEHFAKE